MTFGRYDLALFWTFICYAACSVIVPVILEPLARELKFPLAEGGMAAGGALHLGRSIPMVFSMAFCGFAAGRWGKARSMGFALLLMGLGIVICSFSSFYGMLFLAIALAGLGEGTIEGLSTPVSQDLHPEEPGRYINFTHAFWSIGVLGSALLAGAILTFGVQWRMILCVTGIMALIPAVMFLWPASRSRQQFPDRHAEPLHWRVVWIQMSEIVKYRHFWLFFVLMFLAGGGEFCLTFWCASFIRLDFAGSAWDGGVGTACFAGGMILGRLGWGYWIRQHQLKELVVYSALAGTAISLCFPWLKSLSVMFVLLFFIGIATGPFWPSLQSYCADRMPHLNTTMLFILLSCAGIPGCGFFTWLMGVLGDWYGLRPSFLMVPVCYLLIAGITAFDWLALRENKREPASSPVVVNDSL